MYPALPPVASDSVDGVRLKSFLASSILVAAACVVYRNAPFPFHQAQFGELYGFGTYRFTGAQYLYTVAALYVAALGVFHAVEPSGMPSKALRAWWVVMRFVREPVRNWEAGLQGDERVAVLASLLKAFFAPMMAMALMIFCHGALSHGAQLLQGAGEEGWLRGASYWFVLRLIVFIDVAVFTVGYLVELPALGNRIRSVDPSPWGWAAALACYPPFNVLTGYLIGSTVSEFPQFDDPAVHVLMNAALLVFLALYSSASLALGWKGSNLTHRGIVSRGPYAVVRHPAYVCKNLAWWIGSVPIIVTGFETSLWAGAAALLSMASWSCIYVLRALTEEDHLRKVDGDYDAYAAKVRWRFVPGLV